MTQRIQRSDPAEWGVASGYTTIGVDLEGNLAVRNGTAPAVMPQKLYARRHTLAFGDLSEFDSPKASIAMGAALPSDAVVTGASATIATPFSDGDASSLSVEINMYAGESEIGALSDGAFDASAAAARYAVPLDPAFRREAGLTPVLDLDAGEDNLDDFTAGSVVFEVFFYRSGEVSNG